MKLGEIKCFINKVTGKLSTRANYEANPGQYKILIHKGFFQQVGENAMIVSFTSQPRTKLSFENQEIKFKNIQSYYIDKLFINKVYVFDKNTFNYFEFEDDIIKFTNFFKDKPQNKGLTPKNIVKWAVHDFYRAYSLSIEGKKLELVKIGELNKKLTTDEFYKDSFKFLNEDYSTKEKFIAEMLAQNYDLSLLKFEFDFS